VQHFGQKEYLIDLCHDCCIIIALPFPFPFPFFFSLFLPPFVYEIIKAGLDSVIMPISLATISPYAGSLSDISRIIAITVTGLVSLRHALYFHCVDLTVYLYSKSFPFFDVGRCFFAVSEMCINVLH
jgi:hypothetical protein